MAFRQARRGTRLVVLAFRLAADDTCSTVTTVGGRLTAALRVARRPSPHHTRQRGSSPSRTSSGDINSMRPSAGDGVHDDRPHRPVTSSRGYSSPQVKGSTEEERLGLVKRDSNSAPRLAELR